LILLESLLASEAAWAVIFGMDSRISQTVAKSAAILKARLITSQRWARFN
jgi:hypothetical protein